MSEQERPEPEQDEEEQAEVERRRENVEASEPVRSIDTSAGE